LFVNDVAEIVGVAELDDVLAAEVDVVVDVDDELPQPATTNTAVAATATASIRPRVAFGTFFKCINPPRVSGFPAALRSPTVAESTFTLGL
jgi:hypothetical protein